MYDCSVGLASQSKEILTIRPRNRAFRFFKYEESAPAIHVRHLCLDEVTMIPVWQYTPQPPFPLCTVKHITTITSPPQGSAQPSDRPSDILPGTVQYAVTWCTSYNPLQSVSCTSEIIAHGYTQFHMKVKFSMLQLGQDYSTHCYLYSGFYLLQLLFLLEHSSTLPFTVQFATFDGQPSSIVVCDRCLALKTVLFVWNANCCVK